MNFLKNKRALQNTKYDFHNVGIRFSFRKFVKIIKICKLFFKLQKMYLISKNVMQDSS